MNVPATRPASTVVILRATDRNPLEVLLVRRSDKVAFMGGAFVFPGGRVDEEDQAHAASIEEPHPPSRFSDLTPREELAFRIAAVREMQEEANVTITISDLVPFAHWVTPEIETKRYDTRFFVARMPAVNRQSRRRRDDRPRCGCRRMRPWRSAAAARSCCRRRPGRR